MRSIIVGSALVLLVAVGVVAFILKQGGNQGGLIETRENTAENLIVYTDNGFSPNVLQVELGDAVVFRNESSGPFWPASAMHPTHEVYDGTKLGQHCPGASFDACEALEAGAAWSFVFEKEGSWKYHDHLAPSMTGTVVVQ